MNKKLVFLGIVGALVIGAEVLSRVLARADDTRVLAMPDHPTPIRIRTHAQEPVPFVMWPAPPTLRRTPGKRYTEADARSTGQHLRRGTMLMGHLLA